MSSLILPVIHAEFDAPLILLPLSEIVSGGSCDGIKWHLAGTDADWRWGPQSKRCDYDNGYARDTTGGACSWDEWLLILSTDGIRSPVVWYPEKRMLGNGHHRVTAALDLGWTHIPVVLADYWSGGSLADPSVYAWSVSDMPAPRWQRRPELVNA